VSAPTIRRAAPLLLLLCLLAPSALADGASDGNAGLEALNQGDYDAAIAHFTRAIKYGGLSPDDEEFAYANRGRAYLKKADYSAAVADLDRARQMKPDDNDAQGCLVVALQAEIPPDSIPDRPKPSAGAQVALGLVVVLGTVLTGNVPPVASNGPTETCS
jgi:tetratricopeptide (TPR) repeat protein